MLQHFKRHFQFRLESWIQRGILSQLAIIAMSIVAVAVTGGVLAWATTSSFAGPHEGVWWAFLRLTDPGYLGDDEGAGLRTISTVVTVLGYVLFMGSLIAILTQWLAGVLHDLESGTTPITLQDHVVVLGWTNRTPEVVRKLLVARGRLTRFLQRVDSRRLRVVVVAPVVNAARVRELRLHLGSAATAGEVLVRQGSPLDPDDLARFNLHRAAAILVPGSEFEAGGSEMNDTRVVKTLLSLAAIVRDVPHADRPEVVAEVFDFQKHGLAERAYGKRLELVPSHGVIARIVSQAIRHEGVGPHLLELFHTGGPSLYLREAKALEGMRVAQLGRAYDEAIVLGILRRDRSGDRLILDPGSKAVLAPGDLVVCLAERYDKCRPAPDATRRAEPEVGPRMALPAPSRKRVLVLGWSHKIGALLEELALQAESEIEVVLVSRASLEDRAAWLQHVELDAQHLHVEHVQADAGRQRDLESLKPATFDSIVLMASEWMQSADLADARTVLSCAFLDSMFAEGEDPPQRIVELLDPSNTRLLDDGHRMIFETPRVIAHLLSHVALRPELNDVFDELFGPRGAEIECLRAEDLGLVGRPVRFLDVQQAAWSIGITALGIQTRRDDGTWEPTTTALNPDRARTFALDPDDRIVVLAGELRT